VTAGDRLLASRQIGSPSPQFDLLPNRLDGYNTVRKSQEPATKVAIMREFVCLMVGVRPTHRQGRSRYARWLAWLMLGATASSGLTGCSAMRHQRSAECSRLCDDARRARESGQTEQAHLLLDEALRQRPTDPKTRLEIAEELVSNGRELAAAEELEQLLQEAPDDPRVALQLTEVHLSMGRTEAAAETCQQLLRQDPRSPDGFRLLAEIEGRRGDWPAAMQACQSWLLAEPASVPAQLKLGEVHCRMQQYARAAAILRSVVQTSQATAEQRVEAQWHLGLAYAGQQRWADAADQLIAAAEQRRCTADDWYQLAFAQSKAGRSDNASTSLNRALAERPEHQPSRELARQIKRMATGSPIQPAGFQQTAAADVQNDDGTGSSRTVQR
jgi:tetratricopeptide (TPR) repeat protein